MRTASQRTRRSDVADLITFGTAVVTSAKKAWEWSQRRTTWTVSVSADDYLYDEVHAWLLGTIGDNAIKALVAAALPPNGDGPDYYGRPSSAREIKLFSDDSNQHSVRVEGFLVKVSVSEPEPGVKDMQVFRKLSKIVFTVGSIPARDAVVRLLESLIKVKASRTKQPQFWTLNSYGDWVVRSTAARRAFDTVILREGIAEGLLADIKAFLASERDYYLRGIPFHRNVLLYGPPGGGKTSICTALATELKLDVWYLPLGDLKGDANLVSLVGEIRGGGMLVLEDVDVFHAATSREEGQGATLSGLLNALDGMATPEGGFITVLTTNHIEALDPAMLRTGRVDRRVFIDYLDDDQANRLFEFFYRSKPKEPLEVPENMPASDLMEIFKTRFEDPMGAEEELRARKAGER